jgi:hypothetical protein
MLLAGDNAPQGTGGGHEQSKGMRAHNALALTTLVLRHAIIGMAIMDINGYQLL